VGDGRTNKSEIAAIDVGQYVNGQTNKEGKMPDLKEAAIIMLIALLAVALASRIPAIGAAVYGRAG